MLPLWTFLIRKRQFTILLMVALLCGGFYALRAVPKESAPEVRIPVGIVSIVMPGASAEDVERLVTDKVESGLGNLDNLNKLTSTSREGLSTVVAEFNAKANLDKSIQDLKDAVAKIKPDLPEEAKDPTVTQINFADQPILIISVSGDYAPTEMTKLGDELKDDLQTLSGVSRVEVSGVRAREVQVVVEKEKLAQYGMKISDVVGALQAANASLPVGSITVNQISYAINFKGDIRDPGEVRDVAIPVGNGLPAASGGATPPVYMRDIAQVFDGVEDTRTISRASLHGAPASPSMTLTVFKSSGGNVVAMADLVKKRLAELQKTTLRNANVIVSIDQGKEVNKDLKNLTETGLITMALVMLTLFLTLGWRESLIASASIPLSFLIAFIGLWASGNTINFVSLFSLILAIGILVDSGIVVTEAIHTRLPLFPTKEEAAIASLKEYAWPLIGGTMTTIAVFIPLFFISGIVGQFIASIPFTLIFVLIASIFVALGFIPLIAIMTTTRTLNRFEVMQEAYFLRFLTWYKLKLSNILGNRRTENWFLFLMAIAFFVALSLPISGAVKSVFFPQDDTDFVYLSIEEPEGTTLAETDLATRRVEEILYETPSIDSFVTTVGAASALSNNPESGSKLANITVLLPTPRKMTSTQFVSDLRKKFENFHSATVRVLEPSGGPPSGAPVLIKFFGDDLDDLERAALSAEHALSEIKGATEIDTSIKNNNLQITLTVDKQKAAQFGLTPAQIAVTLRTAINGVTATKIKQGSTDIDVVVKMDLNPAFKDPADTAAVNPDAIRNISIETPGGPILLGTVLTASLSKSNAIINHEDRKRLETVTAYTTQGTTAQDVSSQMEAKRAQLQLPEGVVMKIGGENEDINKSFTEMGLAFIAGVLLMLAILVLEFNSFRHTVYLISIIFLSLIGVMGGLLITGQPLSFSSLLGVIALSGVIINHAIILLDSMHRMGNEESTLSLKEVVIEASASRLRPIVLTTITTVVGMIPLTQASALWGPLAYAIMFGLAFSMILTLVWIPVLYNRWPGKKFARKERDKPPQLLGRGSINLPSGK